MSGLEDCSYEISDMFKKKSDLINESKKEKKHVKHSICHSDLIAKVFVSVPPADEKPSMTYSEWRVSHPL